MLKRGERTPSGVAEGHFVQCLLILGVERAQVISR